MIVLRPLLLCLLVATASAAEPADLLLTGGRIYTGLASQPTVETVAVTAGRIVFAGSAKEAAGLRGPKTRVIDLQDAIAFPGFADAHCHLAGIGARETKFDLEGTTGIADLQSRLRERAAGRAQGQWLSGRGWIETHWIPTRFPTRQDLDTAVSDRPVVLGRADGHAIVANSLALKLARIDRTTPNPPGGEILRDDAGEPTGVLVDNAATLVLRLVPPPTQEERIHDFIIGAERETKLGWTQLHIAGTSRAEAELMRQLVTQNRIKLRIIATIGGPGDDASRLLQTGVTVGANDGRFTVRGLKLYMDGALGSRGAALLEPYADSPSSRGTLINAPDQLRPILEQALRAGVQIQTHAIGDRGNRLVLDLYEEVFQRVPPADRKVPDPRWRIEHAQVISPADLPRFSRLGIIPSMQPSHAIGDLYFAPARLGPSRLAGAYAWRSLIDSGAIIPGGSDAPVERGEPLIEFYAAVARKSLDGFANADWHPEQRVTRAEALKMFTLWPAYAAFEEKDRGTIEVGKRADFTVFSADIMTIPETDILKARCVLTIVGGQVLHDGR